MAKFLKATNGQFPREDVNPEKKKTAEFNLDYARAALGMYQHLPKYALGNNSTDRYNLIRKYAQAKQPMAPYIQKLTPQADSDENGMLNQLVVSDRICPVLVKPRRTIITLLKNANEGYYTTINPIDPQAAEELDQKQRDLKARITIGNALKKQQMPEMADNPMLALQPGEPKDLEGAEVAGLGRRHESAMKSELVVRQVLVGNDYDRIRELLAEDWVDYGVAITKDDTNGYRVTIRRVDPRAFVCSPCSQPDLSDIRYAGELRQILVSQLIADSNGQVTEEQVKEIYDIGQSPNGNSVFIGGIYNSWEDILNYGKVQVFDLEYISTDIDAREERNTKYGNKVFGKAKWKGDKVAYNEARLKTKVKRVQNRYCVKWVVGSDIVYDYGLGHDNKIDPHNPSQVLLSYHIEAAELHDMVALSRTELLIDGADQIQLRRMKLEHRFNTARPHGYSIDMSAMDEIAIGPAGKETQQKMSPKDIIALLITHGVLLWRSESLIDGSKVAPPISDLVADLSDVVEYWNDIQRNLTMMNQLVGLNEVTDGSAPDPKRLNEATRAAVVGTKNALSDLFSADRRMILRISESVLIRAQYIMKTDNAEAFISSLGASTVAYMKAAPCFDRYKMGVTLSDRPSPDQLQAFEEELHLAIQAQQIGIDDVAEIRNMENLKQRNAYLVYKVRKNKEEAQQREMQNMQANSQAQIQSAQAAEQAKQETTQLEYKLKSELSKQEHLQKMDELALTSMGRNEDQRISATGRTDAALAQARGRDETNIRDNQTKLISEGQGAAAGAVSAPADLKKDIKPLTSAEQPIVPGIEQLQQGYFSFLPNKQSGMPGAGGPPPPQGGGMTPPGMEEMPEGMTGPEPAEEGMEEEMPEEGGDEMPVEGMEGVEQPEEDSDREALANMLTGPE